MLPSRAIVKYHHRRALLTVDVNMLFSVLFDAYGDDFTVEFIAMNDEERAETIEMSGDMALIRELFRVYEPQEDSAPKRRPDIEQAARRAGRK